MNQSTELEYAGFWIRVGASLIDTILLIVIILPLMMAFYGEGYLESELIVKGPMDFLLSWVAPAVIVIAFWIMRQATPGKMALQLRILDANTGAVPSTGQCIGRYFAYFVSMIPICLGLVWVGFDARKQGWHDKLAGTVVVRRRADMSARFSKSESQP
jgi:uncharacterized RDD family membrane protein YckC